MKTSLFAGVALALSLAFITPAAAQESSYTPGGYTDVSGIDVLDGQFENYMDYLAGPWKAQNEWAKSKGYITSYSVMANNYAREGEPDLFLVVSYSKIYDTAEQLRQQKEFEAFMKADTRTLDKQYGARGTMRKSLGGQQLQELKLK
jgi:hypothetical protein